MDILVVDIETFYSQKFSLSKMTTEEYVRDSQFETIGVAVRRNDEPAEWFSGTKAQTKRWLAKWDWASSVAVAHNAMFDMAILNWHFDIRPKRIADTLSMLRAIDGPHAGNSLAKAVERYGLGEKGTEVTNALGKRRLDFTDEDLERYGDYCVNDVELTHKLFEATAPLMPVSELRLIDLTIRMFTEPVLVLDKEVLTNHVANVRSKKAKLMEAIEADKDALMSNPKLAALLTSLGVIPPTKISPATGKEAFAFAKSDEGFKALLEHHNPRVQAVVAARLGVKSTLEETRTERFIHIADRGPLPVPLRYYAAHTGRWGGDDKVNLQNLPRKSPLKKSMKAPEGYVFIDCDSSQIEARTLAWLAGQNDLVDAFDRGEDVYKIMASSIYDTPVEDVTDDQRFVGKTTILGCLAEGTLVLTDRGWVAIEEVASTDKLWDGEEWVCHQGLVKKGIKQTLNVCGLWLTPDHKILCGTQWLEAQSVAQDKKILSRALDTGAAGWSSLGIYADHEGASALSPCNVTVDFQNTPWTKTISNPLKALAALCAVGRRGTANGTGNTYPPYLIQDIGKDCSIDLALQSLGATTLKAGHSLTTEVGVLKCVKSGETTELLFYAIPKLSLAGTTLLSTWTEQTITEGMSQTISGLSQGQITTPTAGKLAYYSRNLMTYDIAYAGPRNRYTVATDAGPLIVHNCGYGMGGTKFQLQLKTMGVTLLQKECNSIVYTYRNQFSHIPLLWEQGDKALEALIDIKTAPLGSHEALLVDMFGIRLPNGMYLRYANLRKEQDKKTGRDQYVYDVKKGRATLPTYIYGGKLIENVCQALARIIIGEQMLMIARRYKVVMTVHDAVGVIAPIEEADEGREFVEACMRIRPKWATKLPLNCESKIGASYGG